MEHLRYLLKRIQNDLDDDPNEVLCNYYANYANAILNLCLLSNSERKYLNRLFASLVDEQLLNGKTGAESYIYYLGYRCHQHVKALTQVQVYFKNLTYELYLQYAVLKARVALLERSAKQ